MDTTRGVAVEVTVVERGREDDNEALLLSGGEDAAPALPLEGPAETGDIGLPSPSQAHESFTI